MSTDVVSVPRHTPIAEVIELLVARDITGIPVVNDDGTLAGIVTEKEIPCLLSQEPTHRGLPEYDGGLAGHTPQESSAHGVGGTVKLVVFVPRC